ncbi:MAG: hypothetical protein KME45_01820 [Stenomitos rutilans HA7619-LM2]|jgi:hypothetical protein|nr:hypothetical protein [Stenomitos rutilans HA7619-LM2]
MKDFCFDGKHATSTTTHGLLSFRLHSVVQRSPDKGYLISSEGFNANTLYWTVLKVAVGITWQVVLIY